MANFIGTQDERQNFLTDLRDRRPPPQGGSGGGGISPRLDELGNNVSSAEEELNSINQRLDSADSKLGGGENGGLGKLLTNFGPQPYGGAGPRIPMFSALRPESERGPLQSLMPENGFNNRAPAADGGLMELMGGQELTAGAPSIKYEGDMNPDQGSGIMQMASMESGQEGTLEEIYFELIADGMDPEAASIKAREIYNNMSSQPQDMMQEPRTMAADGGVMQLVKPSKDGKRPGYRGDAAYGSSSRSSQATSIGQARGATGSGGGASLGGGRDRDEKPAQQIISGKSYDVTPETKDQRDMLFEIANEQKQTLKDDFIDKPAEYPKFTPSYLQVLGNLNRKPNRKFFIDRVLKAGKIPNYADLYDEDFDIEEAYKNYMDNRLAGKTDAMGNPVPGFSYEDGMLTGNFIDSGNDQQFIPTTRDDSEEEAEEEEPFQLGLAFRADGGRVGKAYGGSMGDDGRRAYGLGSIFKKIKKVFKSPLGKAALLGLGGYGLSGGLGGSSFMQGLKSQGLKGLLGKAGSYALKNPGVVIPAASAAAALFTDEEEEDTYVDNTGIDVKKIRANPYEYLARANRAEGGPMGGEIMEGESEELLDMNGMEKDYREDGGFVPIGEYEKKDDVPARLSKNEFVFTADAVRGAGEGDVDLGAEKLYTQMKELESVGKRMQGANEMFETSQRLEEII